MSTPNTRVGLPINIFAFAYVLASDLSNKVFPFITLKGMTMVLLVGIAAVTICPELPKPSNAPSKAINDPDPVVNMFDLVEA